MNGQLPSDVCLKSWLSVTDEPPDIYAVAFQELDLSPKAITFSESRPDPVWMWVHYVNDWILLSIQLKSNFPSTTNSQKVKDGLHPGADYEELISVRLVGMMLVICVRQELRKNIVRYSTETVGTGALNFMVSPLRPRFWLRLKIGIEISRVTRAVLVLVYSWTKRSSVS